MRETGWELIFTLYRGVWEEKMRIINLVVISTPNLHLRHWKLIVCAAALHCRSAPDSINTKSFCAAVIKTMQSDW